MSHPPACRLCAAFALLALPGPAPAAPPDDPSKQVDALVHRYVREDGPGMAVLVVRDGRVVHRKGYGLADLAKRVPIAPDTNFDLASLSKQFTGMAVMLLNDQGRLSFDDDVRKHLKAVPVFDEGRPIRVRDLLTHTSGLRKDYPDEAATNEAVLQWLARAKAKALAHPTGTRHLYSNLGYALLALVVEKASGKSYNAFLQEEVFKHLGMKRTVAFENAKVSRHAHALGYELLPTVKEFNEKDQPESVLRRTKAENFTAARPPRSYAVGDGGVWSSLDDLALWDEAVRDRKLAKAETWAEALAPARLPDGKAVDYGFGWGLTVERRKVTELWHEGGYGGFSTLNSIYLRDGLCVVILCNIDGFDYLSAIGDRIHDIYLGQPKGKK